MGDRATAAHYYRLNLERHAPPTHQTARPPTHTPQKRNTRFPRLRPQNNLHEGMGLSHMFMCMPNPKP